MMNGRLGALLNATFSRTGNSPDFSKLLQSFGAVLVLLAAGVMWAEPAHAQLPQLTQSGGQCPGDQRNNFTCTANEIDLDEVRQVQDGNQITECLIGTTVSAEFVIDLGINANARFDPLVWFGENGNDPRQPSTVDNTCYVTTLPDNPNVPEILDIDGDACSDVDTGNNAVIVADQQIGTVEFLCQDQDNDGLVEIPALVTWIQQANSNQACNAGNFPANQTPSKCDFSFVESAITVVGRVNIVKDATPSDGTDFNFEYDTPTVSDQAFSLMDGETFTITETLTSDNPTASIAVQELNLPIGWQNTDIVCDAAATIDVNTSSLTVEVSQSQPEVTCTFTNVERGSIDVAKTANPNTYDTAGQTITYSFVITNTGGVVLNNVGVTDPLPGLGTITCGNTNPGNDPFTNGTGTLDPAESVTCTADLTIQQGDINTGSIDNTATATGEDAIGEVSDTDSTTITAVQNPQLTLVKTANPQTYDAVGDVIDYSYTVTNSGNISLAGPVTVADDQETVSCPNVNTVGNNDANLDPGESIVCTAQATIDQADLDNGSITNVATASADGVDSNEDTQTVTAVQNPQLTLVKTANPQTYDSVGDLIDYSYTVTNSGNITLAGPVTIADDQETATCPNVNTVGNNDANLDPGESIVCTAQRSIDQADIDNGSVTNVATASADGVDSNEDTQTVTANQTPQLTLVKTANPQTYDSVGDLIDYSYTVTNSGNITLAGPVTIADDQETATCPNVNTVGNNDANLDPGESIVCTAQRSIDQADIDNGSVTNVATASADGVDSNEDTQTVTANQTPQLTLVKTANPQTYDSVGDLIDYSYTVTNSGNTTLAGPVTVADDQETATCPNVNTVGNNDANLDPGESIVCTAQRTIDQADIDNGSVTNVATASADGVDSNEDTQTVTANQTPQLTLVKTANPQTYDTVGDIIDYSYTVTNSGNITLAGPVTVADDQETATCPNVNTVGNNDANLDPGESIVCTAQRTIDQADLNAGSVTNVATASADGVDSNEDTQTVTAVQNVDLVLVKTADPQTYDEVGDVIDYSYTVTNTGNTSLAGPVTIADDQEAATCPNVNTVGNNDGNLDPDESIVCTAQRTIDQADLDNGSVTNVATASADGEVSNEDTQTVTAVQNPQLTLVKTANPQTYDSVGDVIDYSYTVTNSGNITLAGPVTVADDQETATCPNVNTVGNNDANLDPGESIVCTAQRTIDQGDLDDGSVTNVATASADGVDSNEDTQTVTAVQNPQLTLVKTADPQTYDAVSDTIDYSYTVTNSGNITLAGPVTIADDQETASCPDVNTVGNNDANLDPGESIVCTAQRTVDQDDLDDGSITNVATASADGVDSNEDTQTVTAVQNPQLTLIKTADPQTYDTVGDTIDYSYEVTNSGNITLAGPVTVADDQETATCPALTTIGDNDTDLDPGETVICTAQRTIDQGDLDDGSVTNVATASADGVDSNEDTQTVTAVQDEDLVLVKTADPQTYEVGTVITYEYEVTNAGNTSIPGPVTVDDDQETVTCPDVNTVGDNDGDLDPGETLVCSTTRTADQDDVNAGSITNVATASAGDITSNEDTQTVTAIQDEILTLVKTVDVDDVMIGDTVNYTYTVTNDGNVTLPGPITVTDDQEMVTCPAVNTQGNNDDDLDPGETLVCTASRVISQEDAEAGSVVNIAFASAGDVNSNEDTVTVTVQGDPGIAIDKTLFSNADEDGDNEVSQGDTLTFRIRVTNTGNITLNNVTVSDDLVGLVDEPCAATLDPGASCDVFVDYEVTAEDEASGEVVNVATAISDETDEVSDTEIVGLEEPRVFAGPMNVPTLGFWGLMMLIMLTLVIARQQVRLRV